MLAEILIIAVFIFGVALVGYGLARAVQRARAAIAPPDREDSLKSKLAALQAKYAKGTEAWND